MKSRKRTQEKKIEIVKDFLATGMADGRERDKSDTTIKARNAYLQTEKASLKKLEEVERELMLRKPGTMRST